MDGTLAADGSLGSAGRLKAAWRGDSGVLLGLLLVALLFGFLIGPQFFRPANLELMAIQDSRARAREGPSSETILLSEQHPHRRDQLLIRSA